MNAQPATVLKIRGLKTFFHTLNGIVRAVNGVDLTLNSGETFGIVGESGSGKSVTALSALRLIARPQGKIVSGEIFFKGCNLLDLKLSDMRAIRGNKIAMIFQEPMTSLNPIFTVGRQVAEAIWTHRGLSRRQARREAVGLLEKVGIPAPKQRAGDYPHQLSGGMRQRAMIAMAMACHPEILIADEPTTALDVTIQAQILDLIQELKDETGMAVLLITHNFGVIAETADRTAVMYAGQIVEQAETPVLLDAPVHPYTQGLLRSIPRLGQKAGRGQRRRLHEIKGMVPRLTEARKGCAFAPRCRLRAERCITSGAELMEIAPGHQVRCFA